MTTTKELLERGLPKWPQCIVTGTSVSEKDALEIIRRTDSFFKYTCCNDRDHQEWIQKTLHMPIEPQNSTPEQLRQYFEEEKNWQEKWNYVYLQYLSNDWIASTFAQGAQGWMHPNGMIGYFYNVGKWPEVKEIYEELSIIAKSWPFLELECTLMDREYGENDPHPVVSFLVRIGKVELVDPDERDIHEEFNRYVPTPDEVETMSTCSFHNVLMKGYDSKISDSVLEQWAADNLK